MLITRCEQPAGPAKAGKPVALYLLELRAELHRKSDTHKPFHGVPAGRDFHEVAASSAKKVRD
ncbi:MAG: hypothetical protein HY301_08755 [Verrucomicrobia bacterium]|nr:hypothetical protein [Verrucomicrobiota bacterium]